MKILFIGGTGLISTAVSKTVIKRGYELHILNRGNHNDNLPEEATFIQADINDIPAIKEILKDSNYDVIVDWIAFIEADVKRDYLLFKNHTKHYVFISSASAYQKPLPKLPVTEDIPLINPYWEYSDNKAKSEKYLLGINDPDFNVTIIRPSHTYNDHSIIFQVQPWDHPFTLLKQILDNRPIILPDDGKSLWTLTYNQDFAQAFVDILGNKKAYNECYHLTSDKVYTWEQLALEFFKVLGKEPNILYLPTKDIVDFLPEFTGPLYGDKKDSAVFDNTKIKTVAKNYTSKTDYLSIINTAVTFYLNNVELQTVNQEFLNRYNTLIEKYQK
jgi:nucleoside-diphosphate-sugar epimerase